MKELVSNLKVVAVIFVLISALLLGGLVVQQERSRTDLGAIAGENKAALAERYGKNAGAIYSADDRALAISWMVGVNILLGQTRMLMYILWVIIHITSPILELRYETGSWAMSEVS